MGGFSITPIGDRNRPVHGIFRPTSIRGAFRKKRTGPSQYRDNYHRTDEPLRSREEEFVRFSRSGFVRASRTWASNGRRSARTGWIDSAENPTTNPLLADLDDATTMPARRLTAAIAAESPASPTAPVAGRTRSESPGGRARDRRARGNRSGDVARSISRSRTSTPTARERTPAGTPR